MVEKNGTKFILNGRLIDGTGAVHEGWGLRLEGERIAAVGPTERLGPVPPEAPVLDAGGRTVMPGLIEAHIHLCFNNTASIPLTDPRVPPDYVAICGARNAETALASGYTAARSGGCMFNVDVAVKLAIERGLIQGPRLKPSGQEITGTAGVIDPDPSWQGNGRVGMTITVDGPIEARRAARRLIRDGAEVVKAYPSGDVGSDRIGPEMTCMAEDEVRAIAEEVHLHPKAMFAVHATSNESVKMCLRAGADSIEHGFYADDEAIERMAARNVFLVPAIGYLARSAANPNKPGASPRYYDRARRTIEAGIEVIRKAHKAGVRIALGGDYGFSWIPHGSYAYELQFYVEEVGFTPMEAILAATKVGGEIMQMPEDLGTLEAGKYADILVVNGDPLADIRILQDRSKLDVILKGGEVVGGAQAAGAFHARVPALAG